MTAPLAKMVRVLLREIEPEDGDAHATQILVDVKLDESGNWAGPKPSLGYFGTIDRDVHPFALHKRPQQPWLTIDWGARGSEEDAASRYEWINLNVKPVAVGEMFTFRQHDEVERVYRVAQINPH